VVAIAKLDEAILQEIRDEAFPAMRTGFSSPWMPRREILRCHPFLDDNVCQLKRSTQHLLAVYLQESGNPMSFWDVDSSAARPGRAALERCGIGRFLGGSTQLKLMSVPIAAGRTRNRFRTSLHSTRMSSEYSHTECSRPPSGEADPRS